MAKFGNLHPDGTVSNERDIPQSKMQECPHFMMIPEHYRDDNTCRCDDPTYTEMEEWDYKWDGEKWQ